MSDADAELIAMAKTVRQQAYAPYSQFKVGAALRGQSGKIYVGANVENAAYPLAICAERAAICQAVADGERVFEAIAVVTETGATPCGACRQVLAEFGLETRVMVADLHKVRLTCTVADLLPYGFDAGKLHLAADHPS